MTMNLEKVAAINEDSNVKSIIGYLCWYSVGESNYDRNNLRKLLLLNGFEESDLPNEIRSADAFRRATKDIETKRVETDTKGIYRNYIVRNVCTNEEIIQRNIVEETIDSKGQKLSYKQNEAILIFNRKAETISTAIVEQGGMAEDLAEEACKLFELYKTCHNGQAIRMSSTDILKTMSPTPVRPSGGVYFIPAKYENKLRRLVNFLNSLEKGEGFMIPLIQTDENKDMLQRKVLEHLQSTLVSCQELAKQDNVPTAQLKILANEAKRVVSDLADYREIVTDAIDKMESYQELIKNAFEILLDKAAEQAANSRRGRAKQA
ncbi:hypothetical protein M3589_24040 [Heyndrickxia oleronia]|uniref:Uncharacterized protein n=1 Tax=Heyndrickxia oleronia TaxID=38875 RepID=A0AAW6T179_9BACI|nr:DUF6744 family protein [Heyndrickxia oleronia]MCM3240730.1 hypothetical protein [Heyndrickxia oleronia]MDH5163322.1 hypothetical protein [Heyndrickxia oleronia]NYV66505.1 hypothetical protein [Bacillus sp. Gen3]GIN41540.1 hypothetical protein J19TS1_44890 [Heyndrickxia oleronia]